jgi:hypothetical protein
MLELIGVYLLLHMTMVYVGFSLTKMDQIRSRRYFPLAASSGLLTAVLHYYVQHYLRLPDNILGAIVIGVGSGLMIMLLGLFMLPRSRTKVSIVAAVVCFADLIFAMLLLR